MAEPRQLRSNLTPFQPHFYHYHDSTTPLASRLSLARADSRSGLLRCVQEVCDDHCSRFVSQVTGSSPRNGGSLDTYFTTDGLHLLYRSSNDSKSSSRTKSERIGKTDLVDLQRVLLLETPSSREGKPRSDARATGAPRPPGQVISGIRASRCRYAGCKPGHQVCEPFESRHTGQPLQQSAGRTRPGRGLHTQFACSDFPEPSFGSSPGPAGSLSRPSRTTSRRSCVGNR